MNQKRPNLFACLVAAFGVSATAAALIVELYGKPNWVVRAGAIGLIVLALALVGVWFWGYREGEKAAGGS